MSWFCARCDNIDFRRHKGKRYCLKCGYHNLSHEGGIEDKGAD